MAQNSKVSAASIPYPDPQMLGKQQNQFFPSGKYSFPSHWSWELFSGSCSLCSVAVMLLAIGRHSQSPGGVPAGCLGGAGPVRWNPGATTVNSVTWGESSSCFLSCKTGMIIVLLRVAVKMKWVRMWEVLNVMSGMSWAPYMYLLLDNVITIIVSLSLLCSQSQMFLPEWHSWQVLVWGGCLMVVIGTMPLVKLERWFSNGVYLVFSCKRAER